MVLKLPNCFDCPLIFCSEAEKKFYISARYFLSMFLKAGLLSILFLFFLFQTSSRYKL